MGQMSTYELYKKWTDLVINGIGYMRAGIDDNLSGGQAAASTQNFQDKEAVERELFPLLQPTKEIMFVDATNEEVRATLRREQGHDSYAWLRPDGWIIIKDECRMDGNTNRCNGLIILGKVPQKP